MLALYWTYPSGSHPDFPDGHHVLCQEVADEQRAALLMRKAFVVYPDTHDVAGATLIELAARPPHQVEEKIHQLPSGRVVLQHTRQTAHALR